MKNFFRPIKLLFYLLSTVLFFFVGMIVAGWSGVAEGQGLAGGAIIFGYGLMAAGLTLILSIITGQYLSDLVLRRLNWFFVALIFSTCLILRFRALN